MTQGRTKIEDVVDEAQELRRTVGEASDELYTELASQAETHPYRTLGMAAGVGFVLAGGLTPRVASLALTMGGRWLVQQITDQLVPRS